MYQPNYTRIEQAVDTNLMSNTHAVCVGAGGSYGLLESLCRSGIKKLTIIDFDKVEASNLVRQGYQIMDIGTPKVQAVKKHLKQINPETEVVAIEGRLQDVYKTHKHLFQSADIMLCLTDSFKAQAFGNKIALRHQIPTIWAGYYERSHYAEIVFYIPGVTPSCFRCVTSPRYKMQAQEPVAISSNCNTVFHSQLLDSYVGMLVFAILHNHTQGYEYSNWFGDYWDRNLIQFKVHPERQSGIAGFFDQTFKGANGKAQNFNSIWQKVERDLPPKYALCPDCRHIDNMN